MREKKDAVIRFRVTADEKLAIIEAACAEMTSVSDWLLKAALREAGMADGFAIGDRVVHSPKWLRYGSRGQRGCVVGYGRQPNTLRVLSDGTIHATTWAAKFWCLQANVIEKRF